MHRVSLVEKQCGTYTVIHELGHAVGLFHEHQHPKRNLVLLLDNIPPHVSANNYAKVIGRKRRRYDPKSVMHYQAGPRMCVPKQNAAKYCDFGQDERDGCIVATEEDCDRKASQNVRQKEFNGGLSIRDVAALRKMYP